MPRYAEKTRVIKIVAVANFKLLDFKIIQAGITNRRK
jgi:hypothetical protein